ncbi:MAG TPA: fatty acid oxidation complex subunit alpha FadJ [Polyangiaceae bacterium]
MSIFTTDVQGEVAVITMDDPDGSANTITEAFARELLAVMDRVNADTAVRACVLRSAKRDFVVGANISLIRSLKTAGEAESKTLELARGMGKLGTGPKPFVAAVNGQALGGGFELALACSALVAADDAKLGLPEVQLGLLPAANGLLRVADRAGLQVAIDLGLTGRSVRASKAKKLGLADEVCPQAILLEVAKAKALALTSPAPKEKTRRSLSQEDLVRMALERNPAGRAILFKKARQETRKKTQRHYPATERILDVLERYGSKGFEAAAELEAKAFGALVVSETSRQLVGIFLATQALKKDNGTTNPKLDVKTPERIGVLGGGLMGGGIAYVSIDAGIDVRLKDKDDAGVGRGLKYVRELLDGRVKKAQISREERDQTFARLGGTTDLSGFKSVDVVVEAVFEDLDLKHRVLREVEGVIRPDCIFASNTSSIPIGRIAEASKRPENVVGMHYFSPVHKMPLLEVIRAAKTSDEVVAKAVALGKKQGKTVIVVRDGVGFYTSRILAPYMNEAACLLAEGIAIETIDDALVSWGWPIGAIQLLDEVGLDVAAHVGPIMVQAFGSRLTPPKVMEQLVADDRKGRKNGRGFYRYGKGTTKGKKAVDESVYALLGVTPGTKVPPEEIQMRCGLAMVNEAIRCLGEGILRSPRDGDIGAIFGLGFPPFRGGPFRYVDSVGAEEVLRRLEGYETRFGERFAPAPLLVETARKGARFHQE